jgi:hypothetical protein
MLVPFSYTRYANSRLATCVSFFGGLMIAGGLATAVLTLVEGEMEGIAAGAVIALVGFGLNKLAESIANKKNRA